MKKLITLVLTLAILASLFVLPSAAITEAEVAALKYCCSCNPLRSHEHLRHE